MAINAQINTLQASGDYEVIYPQTVDENIVVNDLVKEILSLSKESMLDEVLLSMVLPVGKYAVNLTVTTQMGNPVRQAKIIGLVSYSGQDISTDENGMAFGFCDTNSATIGVEAGNIQDISTTTQVFSLQEKIINPVSLMVNRSSATQKTYSVSQTIMFTDDVGTFDLSAIGGGEDGQFCNVTPDRINGSIQYVGYGNAGRGGNAGQIINQAGITYNGGLLDLQVGAHGNSQISGAGISYTANYGGGAVGGQGSYSPNVDHGGDFDQKRSATNGAGSSGFLYPPTQVGGAGGGGSLTFFGGFDGYEKPGEGGSPGGGKGGYNSRGTTMQKGGDGNYPGAGGGGEGCRGGLSSFGQLAKSGVGIGSSGLIGIIWHYKN